MKSKDVEGEGMEGLSDGGTSMATFEERPEEGEGEWEDRRESTSKLYVVRSEEGRGGE